MSPDPSLHTTLRSIASIDAGNVGEQGEFRPALAASGRADTHECRDHQQSPAARAERPVHHAISTPEGTPGGSSGPPSDRSAWQSEHAAAGRLPQRVGVPIALDWPGWNVKEHVEQHRLVTRATEEQRDTAGLSHPFAGRHEHALAARAPAGWPRENRPLPMAELTDRSTPGSNNFVADQSAPAIADKEPSPQGTQTQGSTPESQTFVLISKQFSDASNSAQAQQQPLLYDAAMGAQPACSWQDACSRGRTGEGVSEGPLNPLRQQRVRPREEVSPPPRERERRRTDQEITNIQNSFSFTQSSKVTQLELEESRMKQEFQLAEARQCDRDEFQAVYANVHLRYEEAARDARMNSEAYEQQAHQHIRQNHIELEEMQRKYKPKHN